MLGLLTVIVNKAFPFSTEYEFSRLRTRKLPEKSLPISDWMLDGKVKLPSSTSAQLTAKVSRVVGSNVSGLKSGSEKSGYVVEDVLKKIIEFGSDPAAQLILDAGVTVPVGAEFTLVSSSKF